MSAKRVPNDDEDMTCLLSKIGHLKIQEAKLYDLTHIRACLINEHAISEALIELRKYLCTCNTDAIDNVLGLDILEYLWKYAKSSNLTDTYEICWILTNLSAGNSRQTEVLVSFGIIELMAFLLQSDSEEVVIQALWAIGNISGDQYDYRQRIMHSLSEFHGLSALVGRFNLQSEFPLKVYAWTLSNLCRLKANNEYWSFLVNDLQFCIYNVNIFECNDDQTIIDFSWGLTRTLHSISSIRRKQLVNPDLVNGLYSVLGRFKYPNVLVPVFRVLTNIVAGDNFETKLIVEDNKIDHLFSFLHSKSSALLKECLMCLSNIAASDLYGKYLHNYEILKIVLNILQQQHASEAIKLECLWILSNCVAMREDILFKLVHNNLINTLIQCLQVPYLSKKAMDSLYFLEICSDALFSNIKGQLVELQGLLEIYQHDNSSLQQRAKSLLNSLKRKQNKKDSLIEIEDDMERMMIE